MLCRAMTGRVGERSRDEEWQQIVEIGGKRCCDCVHWL